MSSFLTQAAGLLILLGLGCGSTALAADLAPSTPSRARSSDRPAAAVARANGPLPEVKTPARAPVEPAAAPMPTSAPTEPAAGLDVRQLLARNGPTVVLFALASLVPAGLLMVTAYVRISIVLTLLRQALGSPQVPGNQVLAALSLLLTALVMRPVAESVYARAIQPYAAHEIGELEAWRAGTRPIKLFMVEQIQRTNHVRYLWQFHDAVTPPSPGRPDPTTAEEFPLAVVAPAFLLSEITTALVYGFAIYLPFLVVDLVVSAVLTAMGLFMLPPTLVALPAKLILFVLADGWSLVAGMLLRSFA